MLLLGAITSLPEMSAVSTGAFYGNAALATNNLLGSLAVNVAMIAVVDAVVRQSALTALVGGLSTLLQAILSIVALTLTVTAMTVGDRLVAGVGVWTAVIAACVVTCFWLAAGYGERSQWQIAGTRVAIGEARSARRSGRVPVPKAAGSTGGLVFRIGLSAIVIVCAGFMLARTSEAIANQTGLKARLAGFLLLGFVTSLPELATILGAVRLGRYDMAIADVFGTNLFNVGLLVVADAFYSGGPILNETNSFERVACLLCLLMSAIYAVGLLERRDRTFCGLGYDFCAVIASYIGGLAILYWLR